MTTLACSLRTSINVSSLSAFLLLPFLLGCFAVSPQAQAICQEGCSTNYNTFLGDEALVRLTKGTFNTGIGSQALSMNTSGGGNTAVGASALQFNSTGASNTAVGLQALYLNTTGEQNTAIGIGALATNHTGSLNTAIGVAALASNTRGLSNTAIGMQALQLNRSGSDNIALGIDAGYNITTGSNNIEIGSEGSAGDAGTIRIGSTGTQTAAYIAGITGVTVPGGVGVIVDADGHLGTVVSSARFKDEIKPMDKSSEALFSLKPVSFRYKKEA